MFAGTFRILVASVLLALVPPHAHARPATATEEAELRRTTQELLDAIAPGHVEVWQRYLHERITHVDETDTVRNKAELLGTLQPLPRGLVGSIAIDSFKAEVEGDVAFVTHEDQERLDYFGQPLHSRFRSTDTWLRTADGWRLFGEHTTAVLKDPPSTALTQKQLCEYNGSYSLTADIVANVRCAQDGLTVERTGRPAAKYLAETPDVFFAPGQPRTRRIFVRDAAGRIVGFVDRREGEDVRWTKQS
jgi:ketosteroid isomerase-like protein